MRMKYSPRSIGSLQALGIALYVGLFASVITLTENSEWLHGFEPPMPFGPILFLLAFIISASICGGAMFGYPLCLFLHEKKREAVHTVLWSIGWLIVIFVLVAGSAVLLYTDSA